MRTRTWIMLVLLGVFWPLAALGTTSSKWTDVEFITADQLKGMIDAKENFLLINALSPVEHAELRIVGSVNIPYAHLKKGLVALPEDKGMKLVFYCKGPK